MRERRSRLAAIWRGAAACCIVCCAASTSLAQLRIVDYNIAENYDVAGDPGGLDVILAAIGNEVRNGFSKPLDILAAQETATDGTDAAALAAILNGLYGVASYQAAPVPANSQSGGNGLPGLVYNSATVSLVETIAFGEVGVASQPRSTLRYQLRPVGYSATADFYLYNSHYKSDDGSQDQLRRNIEAVSIRANADALGEGAHAIYAGDFNVYRSDEAMYQTLLAEGPGRGIDPVDMPGSWSAPSQAETFKIVHTQSPATGQAFPGQSLGGMDSRFDFQLVTQEFLDAEGLAYLPGSYRAFGNNGTHTYKEAITTGAGAAPNVLAALAAASDHLPVVADYQLPAMMQVQVSAYPQTVALGAAVAMDVLVQNAAAAIAAAGADELDYTLSVSGDLFGSASGVAAALAGASSHQVTLNTATPGLKSGVVTVAASSQGAANPLFTFPVSFVVGGSGGVVRKAIARDDFDVPLNLAGFEQSPAAGSFPAASGFQRYQVGVSATIPTQLVDQSTGSNPQDVRGVVDAATKSDGWFGVTDTVNPANPSGEASAAWQFDIGGASGLEVSIDMAAMGDFEADGDLFQWSYAIDGQPLQPLFTSAVDEEASASYTMAGGAVINLDDPLSMTPAGGEGVRLTNVLQTLTAPIAGIGSILTLRLEATANGQDEGYAFDNLTVTGLVPTYAAADFNEDGWVDAADLAAWKGNYGQTGAGKDQGDADLDGDVDGADLLAWQRSLSPRPNLARAPEPGGMALASAALAGLAGFRRRKGGVAGQSRPTPNRSSGMRLMPLATW